MKNMKEIQQSNELWGGGGGGGCNDFGDYDGGDGDDKAVIVESAVMQQLEVAGIGA